MEGLGKKKPSIGERARGLGYALAVVGGITAAGGAAEARAAEPQGLSTERVLHDLSAQALPHGAYERLLGTRVNARINLDVALLAYALQPDYAALDQDPHLQYAETIDPSWVLPLVQHREIGAAYWNTLSQELGQSDALMTGAAKNQTPTAQPKLDILKRISVAHQGVDPIELEESVAYVARNLSMKGEQPDEARVKAEVNHILERREAIGRLDLLQQDILLVSADEVVARDQVAQERRFGKQALLDGAKERQRDAQYNQKWTTIDPFVAPTGLTSNAESIAEAKSAALRKIASSTEPLTVYLDGHGSPDAFALSGHPNDRGELVAQPSDIITVDELAASLTERYRAELANHQNGLRVSFIFSACDMQNFARNVADKLSRSGVPLPDVMISASEYGQYGYSVLDNKYGSLFNEMMIVHKSLGDVMAHKHEALHSDPSIFVPRPENPKRLMQVSGIVVPVVPADTQVG